MGRRSEKIKHRKAAQIAIKTRIFARAGKRILAAARSNGPDPSINIALSDAITQARANGVPRTNIDRILDKVKSDENSMDFKESSMEAYGKGGVGVFIEVLTDNMNRAAMEIRTVINKRGLKVGAPGSVGYNFRRSGVVRIGRKNEGVEEEGDENEIIELALELVAEDCEKDMEGGVGGCYRMLIEPGLLNGATEELQKVGFEIVSSQVEMVPETLVECSEEDYEGNLEAIETLEELIDVDGVFHNMKAPVENTASVKS